MDIQVASGTGTPTQTLRNDNKHNTTLRTKCSVSLMTEGMPVTWAMRHQILPVRLGVRMRLQAINAGERLEKKGTSYTVSVTVPWQLPVKWTVSKCLQKSYHEGQSLGPSIPTSGIPRKPSCKHVNTHRSSIHRSRERETAQPSPTH